MIYILFAPSVRDGTNSWESFRIQLDSCASSAVSPFYKLSRLPLLGVVSFATEVFKADMDEVATDDVTFDTAELVVVGQYCDLTVVHGA